MPDLQCHVSPFAAMGTACEIRLFAASPEQAQTWAGLAIADVQRLQARYSRYR